MFKPFTVHPSSILLGLGLAALIALVSGAAQSAGSRRPVPVEQRIIGHIPASWWTFVQLGPSSAPFVVPSDKYFVVVASYRHQLATYVDGQYYDERIDPLDVQWTSGSAESLRVAIPPGASVTVQGGYGWLNLWGYFEPVH